MAQPPCTPKPYVGKLEPGEDSSPLPTLSEITSCPPRTVMTTADDQHAGASRPLVPLRPSENHIGMRARNGPPAFLPRHQATKGLDDVSDNEGPEQTRPRGTKQTRPRGAKQPRRPRGTSSANALLYKWDKQLREIYTANLLRLRKLCRDAGIPAGSSNKADLQGKLRRHWAWQLGADSYLDGPDGKGDTA